MFRNSKLTDSITFSAGCNRFHCAMSKKASIISYFSPRETQCLHRIPLCCSFEGKDRTRKQVASSPVRIIWLKHSRVNRINSVAQHSPCQAVANHFVIESGRNAVRKGCHSERQAKTLKMTLIDIGKSFSSFFSIFLRLFFFVAFLFSVSFLVVLFHYEMDRSRVFSLRDFVDTKSFIFN